MIAKQWKKKKSHFSKAYLASYMLVNQFPLLKYAQLEILRTICLTFSQKKMV